MWLVYKTKKMLAAAVTGTYTPRDLVKAFTFTKQSRSSTGNADTHRVARASACRDSDPNLFFPTGSTGPAVDQIETAVAIVLLALFKKSAFNTPSKPTRKRASGADTQKMTDAACASAGSPSVVVSAWQADQTATNTTAAGPADAGPAALSRNLHCRTRHRWCRPPPRPRRTPPCWSGSRAGAPSYHRSHTIWSPAPNAASIASSMAPASSTSNASSRRTRDQCGLWCYQPFSIGPPGQRRESES